MKMNNSKRTVGIIAIALITLTAMSCRDTRREDTHHRMDSERMDGHHHSSMNQHQLGEAPKQIASNAQNADAKQIVAAYMAVKDALVATDEKAAAKAGKELETTLNSFNTSSYTPEQQKELKDILEDAREHAEHISESAIAHQREHFKILSKDIIDLVAITGTDSTLYQQYCPMYDGGSSWLSRGKDIKNPYYGSKMMNCGKVQREIN